MNNTNIKNFENHLKKEKFLSGVRLYLKFSSDEIEKIDKSLCDLLYDYFYKGKKYCIDTEKQVFRKYPQEFIEAVRTSQVFLKDERLELLKTYDLKEYENHKKVWEFLRNSDAQIWGKIEEELKEVLTLPIEEILIYLTFWIEEQRYGQSSVLVLTKLASVYNFFIKLYLHNTTDVLEKSEEEFSKIFLQIFISNISKKQHNPLSEILNLIQSWITFNEDILQVYCFDLDIEIKEENGIVYFNQAPSNHYKWKLDGIRYQKNRLDYYQKSTEIVTVLTIQTNGKCIPHKDEDTFDLNFEGAIKKEAIKLILEDLQLDDIKWRGEKQGLLKTFVAISGYSHNRYDRYQNNLDKFKEKRIKDWYLAYDKLLRYSINNDIQIDPYLLHTEESFVSITKGGMYDVSNLLRHSFSQLSYEVKEGYKFNRFTNDYDVWQKPFIKVGQSYFSPMAFFATNDWIYSSVMVAIKYLDLNRNIKLRKDTANDMENYLADKFKNKGFKVKQIKDEEVSKINKNKDNYNGDVDIIVEDKNTTLFIQLKRTQLRLNTKNTYYEYINSDKKAINQLNKIENYFKEPNDIFQLQHKPIKWVVSTSFEGINKKIDDCNKINYFDLLFALEKTELKSVKDIINYLENDKNLLDFYISDEDDIELLQGLGLPLELVEPNSYRQTIFATESYNINYNKFFNKALSLSKKRNDKKAIKILNHSMYYNPNDVELYGALGNCYANLKDLPNLQKSFEKALEIVSNEPYIKRNYALALIENGKYFEGIKKLWELRKDYPLVNDFTLISTINYEYHKNKLSKEEHKIIESYLG